MRPRPQLRHALWHLPTLLWLWVLWTVLWASLDALVLVSGALVAVGILFMFPLPPIRPRMLVRPLGLLWLLVNLVADFVVSGVTVGREVVRRGRRTSAAVVEVPVRANTDLTITMVAVLTTVTPGALVLEIDRDRQLLYVHTLPARDTREAEYRRGKVRAVDRRIAGALRLARPRDRGGPTKEAP